MLRLGARALALGCASAIVACAADPGVTAAEPDAIQARSPQPTEVRILATAAVSGGDPVVERADPAEAAASEAPFDPFPSRDDVTVDELVAAIDAIADEVAQAPEVRRDFLGLAEAKGLKDSPELYRDYVRVKLAFEATRDGGWWHLHWAITNEQPNSDRIWSQWREPGTSVSDPASPAASAIAECDELSALFAFFARKLGVHGIGLFWPTWNHVVAVWTVPGVQTESGSPVRIIVPTSQIFLTQDDSLGTEGFDPWKQKTIYEYRRRDVKGGHRIDAELARFFVRQIAAHGRASQAELQRARNERDARLSTG
jgi:hypothetical protein